ncbi:MAG: thiol peroxidase [Desulfohalobiaceae bacterium]|nr:thiol peroxidase [Desulfohalobiaceae bacterium]
MSHHYAKVTMQGNPVTLQGDSVQPGDRAPDFEVTDNDLNPVTLADYSGRVLILSSVPSLDTSVCDMETRRFNNEAANLGEEVTILTISMDLPFAQKRWCGAAGVDRVITLSDHRLASFGQAYGVLISELRLLCRAIFIVDRNGVLQYMQIVPEITQEPDYEDVLTTVRKYI